MCVHRHTSHSSFRYLQHVYCWPLSNVLVRNANPPHNWKFTYNFNVSHLYLWSAAAYSTNQWSCSSVVHIIEKHLHVSGPCHSNPCCSRVNFLCIHLYKYIYICISVSTYKYIHIYMYITFFQFESIFLLKYIWQITLCKFKIYCMLIWYIGIF